MAHHRTIPDQASATESSALPPAWGIIVTSPEHPRIALKSMKPKSVNFVNAPPILRANTHTIDFTCSTCGVVLMHAEQGQVHNLMIHCMKCGAFNSTDR
jgi:predicted RNA-binding Zn-ribbon protein involved in translation (DUF1610 family)